MPFHIKLGSHNRDDVTVLSFHGREEMSNDYTVDLTVAFKLDPSPVDTAFLAQPASLIICAGDQSQRFVHGVIARVGWNGFHGDGHSYRLALVPRFQLLRQKTTSRVFQDLSVPEIIDAVLALHDVPRRWALIRPYAKRGYCVQYRETDYDFTSRLCREEGLLFYFEHPVEAAAEILVLSDDVGLSPAITGDPELTYRPSAGIDGLTMQEQDVPVFAAEWSVKPTAVMLQEYDFERPQVKLVSRAVEKDLRGTGEDSRREHYEHQSDYESVSVERDDAQLRLEQLRRNAHVAVGETPCRRLVPGHRFRLGQHPLQSYNREWVVTAVEHNGTRDASSGKPTYQCRFHAAPDSVQFRSPIARRAVQQVIETATVTGPPGEEIHTDIYGRIKVRFHWDRDGPRDDHSSCWIRHAEPWAGSGYGTQQVPRVGTEVLVTFVGGDVDRPLVLGCVSNATHLPPFQLPAEKTKSGIKTRSTPESQGYNELSFDDASGRERVHLRAERDLSIAVRNDRTVHAGHNSLFTVGAHEQHQAGSRRTQIGTLDALSIAGDKRANVDGHSLSTIGGDRRVHVGSLDRLNVGGASELIVEGTRMVHAGRSFTLSVGRRSTSSTCQISSEGTLSLSAVHTVRISSEQRLVLACGESTTIELDADGIVLRAPKLAVFGSESVTIKGKGPALTLADNAELVAESFTVLSKGAGLELASDAALWGKIIKLNCSKTDPFRQSDNGEVQTKPFRVQLLDERAEPYENKHYVLVAEGERQEGDTNIEGRIDTAIPEAATLVDLTLWVGSYPIGRRRQWSIEVTPLADAATPLGAVQRLKNLGYYRGGIPENPQPDDPSLLAALKWFQQDQELPPRGELDGATVAELSTKHGN